MFLPSSYCHIQFYSDYINLILQLLCPITLSFFNMYMHIYIYVHVRSRVRVCIYYLLVHNVLMKDNSTNVVAQCMSSSDLSLFRAVRYKLDGFSSEPLFYILIIQMVIIC